jgi:hypothetical protein
VKTKDCFDKLIKHDVRIRPKILAREIFHASLIKQKIFNKGKETWRIAGLVVL